MSNLFFHRIAREAVRSAGVRRFEQMGIETAHRVAVAIARKLPTAGRERYLIADLSLLGYYRSAGLPPLLRGLLPRVLPEITIGYRFDRQECDLLASLSHDEAVEFLRKIAADRIRTNNLLRSYDQCYPEEAAALRASLATTSTCSV